MRSPLAEAPEGPLPAMLFLTWNANLYSYGVIISWLLALEVNETAGVFEVNNRPQFERTLKSGMIQIMIDAHFCTLSFNIFFSN